MRDIEAKISPLISSLFPSFYQEEGPNFIAFVKAYYEWLEQNFQLLDLESIENFNVGDTVTQDNVTGKLYAIIDNSILVLVDGLETFKCLNVCSEVIPVTSSSGGNTTILRGGNTRRLGSLFLSRKLLNIRDIDETMDLFVVRFKEKYLKNIEFDTNTNKRLLVKNSLDLYRAKGTSRAIDLFFRLIYGINTTVYTPGDDLFRLSDGEWYRPQYIEIHPRSVDRVIEFVGKQITGVNSEATAFIERYVKVKIKKEFVHLLYVSNARGQFIVGERLKHKQVYEDSPIIVGSLTEATVSSGSESFSIGDLINIESSAGENAVGRVTAVVSGDGTVSFQLLDGGWGYTTNLIDSRNNNTANTFVSDENILVNNIEPGQFITGASIITPGTGYSNSVPVSIGGGYSPAKFIVTTDNSGNVQTVRLADRGSGYFSEEAVPFVESPAGASGLTLSYTSEYSDQYFDYLETLSSPLYTVNTPNNVNAFVAGDRLTLNNDGTGSLVAVYTANSTMVVSTDNNHTIFAGETIARTASMTSNVQISTLQKAYTNTSVINVGTTAVVNIDAPNGVIPNASEVYQVDNANNIIGRAVITQTNNLTQAGGNIEIKDLSGVLRVNEPLRLFDSSTTATVQSVSLRVAVVGNTVNMTDTGQPFVYGTKNGTRGYITTLSTGTGARYSIRSLSDSEYVYVNTDRLSNTTIMNTSLSAVAYNLPANTTANSSSIIYGALSFANLQIGTISNLAEIGPGSGYTADPIASVYQPYIVGYQAHDYIIKLSGRTRSFVVGERINQPYVTIINRVFVANTDPYRYGEFVHAASVSLDYIANGVIVGINAALDYLDISSVVGTMPTTSAYTIKSLISNANSQISSVSIIPTQYIATGIIKGIPDSGTLLVKRIQLDNQFRVNDNIIGAKTNAIATVVEITEEENTPVIGLNANVLADASIANGVINAVQIVDSGFGYSADLNLTYTAADGVRTGELSGGLGGIGTGTGYYRNTKGFVSHRSKIHDGDYYQEYSYDIFSRLPLDRYNDMFKKVMHTAGTRFFGSVLFDSLASVQLTGATISGNSSIEVANATPYVIEDRADIDIQDRSSFYIEIREM